MSSPDPESVRATFEKVAHRYDLANHFLSGGIDYLWRNRLVKLAREEACQQVLDLATGSGDVLFAFLTQGLIDLYEASFESKYLIHAVELTNLTIDLFEAKIKIVEWTEPEVGLTKFKHEQSTIGLKYTVHLLKTFFTVS